MSEDGIKQGLHAEEDWNKRIAPLIGEAVSEAKSKIAQKKMYLTTKRLDEHSQYLSADPHLSADLPSSIKLPGTSITAIPESQRGPSLMRRLARQLPGARNAPVKAEDQPTMEIFLVVANGKIEVRIKVTACPSFAPHGPFTPERFDKEQIELVIRDFVEAVPHAFPE